MCSLLLIIASSDFGILVLDLLRFLLGSRSRRSRRPRRAPGRSSGVRVQSSVLALSLYDGKRDRQHKRKQVAEYVFHSTLPDHLVWAMIACEISLGRCGRRGGGRRENDTENAASFIPLGTVNRGLRR